MTKDELTAASTSVTQHFSDLAAATRATHDRRLRALRQQYIFAPRCAPVGSSESDCFFLHAHVAASDFTAESRQLDEATVYLVILFLCVVYQWHFDLGGRFGGAAAAANCGHSSHRQASCCTGGRIWRSGRFGRPALCRRFVTRMSVFFLDLDSDIEEYSRCQVITAIRA
jgi:hypothetical protein